MKASTSLIFSSDIIISKLGFDEELFVFIGSALE